jgi:glycosyltransferase involved in cell wall biosynthesis
MEKSKVVHIVEDLSIGGLENIVATIVRGLDRRQFDVEVWCLTAGGEIADALTQAGIPVVIMGMRRRRSLGFFLGLCRRLKTLHIDIAHTHGPTANSLARLAAIVTGVPVVIAHLHSTYTWYSRKQRLIERILSYYTDRIICCSWAVAEFAMLTEGIDPRRLAVIYNGVDIQAYALPASSAAGHQGKTIGCVASFVPHKGHAFLLEAARTVIEEYGPGVRFVLVGRGALENALRQQAASLGIDACVLFRSATLATAGIIADFDIAVLPSVHIEGLGLALIEAMAAAKPVVGADVGGIPEVIRDHENGLLVEPADASALSAALLSLLRDPDKARRMGSRGQEIAREKFSASLMVKKIEELYADCLYAKHKKS